mmetsp:Transcript_21405/g.35418  ORF Transcript_21405/g.35418 Transcript_21405/m.35418 type:complete len:405 (-) Transcript_21405:68-1282(-)
MSTRNEETPDTNAADHGVEEQVIPSSTNGTNTKKRTKTIIKAGKVVKKKLVKRKVPKKGANAQDKLIKYSALFLLVGQMVGLVLLMRYTRTNQAPDQPLYLASSAVFIMECMKFFICCCVIAYQSGGNLMGELQEHIINSPMEMVKLCVPSLLYTIQNNLLYLALTNLDAATYQVCYQLKILTTAVFSALLLQRKFSPRKWASLVILTIGVAIVQVSGSGDKHAKTVADASHRFVGLAAVLCAACTSGFAGVYFEKILKGSQTTLWLRNVQMGLPSIVIAFCTIYSKDGKAVAEHGMLGGFSSMVWTVVVVQAAGGLIVAVVVKYADNVLKVFATSFSIIISCIISAIFFEFHATMLFIVGAGLVVSATVMYSAPEGRSRTARKPVLPVVLPSTNGAARKTLVM